MLNKTSQMSRNYTLFLEFNIFEFFYSEVIDETPQHVIATINNSYHS